MKNLKILRAVLAYSVMFSLAFSSTQIKAQSCSPDCGSITIDNSTCCNLQLEWETACQGVSGQTLSLPCACPDDPNCPGDRYFIDGTPVYVSTYPVVVDIPCLQTDCGPQCGSILLINTVPYDISSGSFNMAHSDPSCCPVGEMPYVSYDGMGVISISCQ